MMPVFWFFGRSSAGKTTVSDLVSVRLRGQALPVLRIDGDEMRRGLCADLGFSEEDRVENHRRAAEMAAAAARQGIIVLVSTMAPQATQREVVRRVLGSSLRWIYVNAAVETCATRDPKGLYQRQRGAGHPLDYPFVPPADGECHLILDTEMHDALESCDSACVFILAEMAAA